MSNRRYTVGSFTTIAVIDNITFPRAAVGMTRMRTSLDFQPFIFVGTPRRKGADEREFQQSEQSSSDVAV